jgi:hypothetical protein
MCERALAAAVLSFKIQPVAGTSHRLFNPTPSEAGLARGYSLAPFQGACGDGGAFSILTA